jgi:ABC-type sugar transport system ATPase subunit
MNGIPLLQITGLSKSYEGSFALQGVGFEIRRGEVHALTGENGAGKSTLVKILSGITHRDAGEIRLDGQLLRDLTPVHARTLGIAVVHQDFDLAPNMTVAENVLLGEERQWFPGLVHQRRGREETRRRLQRVGLDVHPDIPVSELSVAQRQLLAIAKTIASPVRLLILDEPTSSLSADDTAHLLDLIRQRKAAGTSVLFISHKLDEVFTIADRISVFRDGRNAGTYATAETSVDDIVRMMVGRELPQRQGNETTAQQLHCLEIRKLEAAGLTASIDLSLHHGEVLGLYGLKGSGRTALLRALFGLEPCSGGEIWLDGKVVPIHSPLQAMRAGMAWVCRDRKERGLFPNLDVQANLTLPALDSLARFGFVLRGKERQATLSQFESLGIRTAGPDQPITALSGGNQQKVMLARWLLCQPRVLVLDEPTAGIDVGAKAEIYALMRRLAAQGMGILLVSSELTEVLALSDRILVMHQGALAGSLVASEAGEEKIMQLIHAGSLATAL